MVPHALITAAIVIGFFVMLGWVVLIAWFIFVTIGEFRFNRILKRRAERDFDNLRSSWLLESKEAKLEWDAGSSRFDTAEIPINFKFDNEDDFATEETAAVFDIRERYPHEFA